MLRCATYWPIGLLAMLAAPAAAAEKPLAVSADDPSLSWSGCPPIFPGACEMTVLHGDPAKPNADVLLKVGPGYRLAAHRHSSAERMILVAGQMTVDYAGHEPIVLNAGDYAFGPAMLAHKASCDSKVPCLLFIAFEGPVDAMAVEQPGD